MAATTTLSLSSSTSRNSSRRAAERTSVPGSAPALPEELDAQRWAAPEGGDANYPVAVGDEGKRGVDRLVGAHRVDGRVDPVGARPRIRSARPSP